MDRVPQRIEYRGIVFGDGRVNFPDIAYGDTHEFGETAVGIDADDFHVLAEVGLSHAAGAATSAIHVHFGANEIARLDRGDLGSNFVHGAAEFMPECHRRVNPRSGPAIPAVNVQVGPAN